MRLINADALNEKMYAEIADLANPKTESDGAMRCGIRLAKNYVEESPTVDAIPVEWLENYFNVKERIYAYNNFSLLSSEGEPIHISSPISTSWVKELLLEAIEDWRKENDSN